MSGEPDAARPILGLLMGLRRAPQWPDLVVALGAWCEPRLADRTGEPPAAYLASSADAPGMQAVLGRAAPVAVASPGDLPAGLAAAVVVWTGPVSEMPAGDHVVACPATTLDDTSTRWPLTPFARARWRAARGLPDDLVVDAAALADEVRPTALALAAAVVARDAAEVVEALAWGAPCVTTAGVAAELGAVDGTHVVVADPAALREAARGLGADHRRGALIGRAGRRLAEQHCDRAVIARRIAGRLGLLSCSDARPGAMERLNAQLDDLGTPPHARIRDRAREATRDLPAPVPEAAA